MVDDFKGRGGSPWGTPPGGGNGSGRRPPPPDIDEIINKIQNTIKKFLPGGSKSGGKPIILGLVILGLIWLASGLYRVLPDEQGVVLRFGKYATTTQPGLNYHVPYPVEIETQEIAQSLLDEYESGIQITQVQTQKADPPDQVIDAFRDVQAARADMERSKNEAEAYANDVIPRARGEAAKILQEAEAYKKQVVAAAEGEASRFLAIYTEYVRAKEVTQERMYLETMEKVLANINKVIIDKNAGSGVVPYLPLPALTKKSEGSDTQ
jgi:regulator of protease activity HflC (stomatin/prohibitin superfamily)